MPRGVLAPRCQLLGEGRPGAGRRGQVRDHRGGAGHRAVQVHVSIVQVHVSTVQVHVI